MPELLDMIASNARTALDDPAGVEDALEAMYDARLDAHQNTTSERARRFAIDQLDEIIEALNPSEETRDAYAGTIEILGRHLAERRDTIAQDELTYDGHSAEHARAYLDAATQLDEALDHIDAAINALRPS